MILFSQLLLRYLIQNTYYNCFYLHTHTQSSHQSVISVVATKQQQTQLTFCCFKHFQPRDHFGHTYRRAYILMLELSEIVAFCNVAFDIARYVPMSRGHMQLVYRLTDAKVAAAALTKGIPEFCMSCLALEHLYSSTRLKIERGRRRQTGLDCRDIGVDRMTSQLSCL